MSGVGLKTNIGEQKGGEAVGRTPRSKEIVHGNLYLFRQRGNVGKKGNMNLEISHIPASRWRRGTISPLFTRLRAFRLLLVLEEANAFVPPL